MFPRLRLILPTHSQPCTFDSVWNGVHSILPDPEQNAFTWSPNITPDSCRCIQVVKMQTTFLLFAVLVVFVTMVTEGKCSKRDRDCCCNKRRQRPNVILMLMDDVGWGDLGCYGNEAMETPNIDRLAAEGARFTDFYSAYPMCSPSRASLMTGRLPIRNGVYTNVTFGVNSVFLPNVTGGLIAEEETLAEILEKLGYRNKVIGKWHIGNTEESYPLNQGFHEFFGGLGNHFGPHDNINYPNIPVYRDYKMVGRYFQDEFFLDLDTGESDLTRLFTEDALEFIEENQDDPFFLYWTPDGAHTPLGAHKDFLGRSQRGLYGDVLMDLDKGVGQIMAKLRELGIENNTFVFFGSDNGPASYEATHAGLSGPFLCSKITTYEGGMRTPGIFWWPGQIPAGQIERAPASLLDVFHTVLAVTGGKVSDRKKPLDGQNLLPILQNKPGAQLKKDSIFYYRGNGLYAVRVGNYKAHYYTWNLEDYMATEYGNPCSGRAMEGFITSKITNHTGKPWLFHLGRDPGETYPIHSSTDEYKDQLKIIDKVRRRHMKSVEDDTGYPQLNYVDAAALPWSPPGCKELDMCLDEYIPESHPVVGNWFF